MPTYEGIPVWNPSVPLILNPSGLWIPMLSDASGNLKVVPTGGASGGTSAEDESAFTAGETYGTPAMGEYSGALYILACDASRNLNVNIAAGSITVSPVTSNTCSNNALVAVGASSVQAIAANTNRKKLILQNLGTTKLYVLLAASGSASATNLTFALPAGGSAADGSSSIYIDEMWQGAVQVASSAAGGELAANECT